MLRRQRSYEKLKTKMAETNLDQKLHDGKKHWEFYMDEDSLETSMKQLFPLVQEKGK